MEGPVEGCSCSLGALRRAGHYHLSHNYGDSIAFVGGCAFVNTGVIGNGSRDGCRHSRLLEGGCATALEALN